MAKIISVKSRYKGKSKSRNVFQYIWDWFNSLDIFIRLSLVMLIIIVLVTPAYLATNVTLKSRASWIGNGGRTYYASCTSFSGTPGYCVSNYFVTDTLLWADNYPSFPPIPEYNVYPPQHQCGKNATYDNAPGGHTVYCCNTSGLNLSGYHTYQNCGSYGQYTCTDDPTCNYYYSGGLGRWRLIYTDHAASSSCMRAYVDQTKSTIAAMYCIKQ